MGSNVTNLSTFPKASDMLHQLLFLNTKRCIQGPLRTLEGSRSLSSSLLLLLDDKTLTLRPNRFSLQYSKNADNRKNAPPGSTVKSPISNKGTSGQKRANAPQNDRVNRFRPREEDRNTSSRPKFQDDRRDRGGFKGHSNLSVREDGKFGSRNRQRELHRFDNDTGTERTRLALKLVIDKVMAAQTNYQVNFRDESGKLSSQHLYKICNRLDMDQEGLAYIGIQAELGLPMVKKVTAKEMLQSYSDDLAAEVEKQLLASGSSRAQKVLRNRLNAEKRKSATKVVNLAWAISISDLQHQKKKEIEKRIANGEKFSIVVGDKATAAKIRKTGRDTEEDLEELETMDSPRNRRNNLKNLDDELYELEMQKRERLLENLDQILEELNCKTTIFGSIDKQIFVNVEPVGGTEPAISESTANEQLSAKEQRRLKRMEKSTGSQKPAAQEFDPDAMYLFKIED